MSTQSSALLMTPNENAALNRVFRKKKINKK